MSINEKPIEWATRAHFSCKVRFLPSSGVWRVMSSYTLIIQGIKLIYLKKLLGNP